MYVKAIKPGMFDLAKNGSFTQIKVGTVFQIPDTMKPGQWMVRCDKDGNVVDPKVARAAADTAKALALRESGEAALAKEKAERAEKAAKDANQRALKLESEEKAKADAEAQAQLDAEEKERAKGDQKP